MAFKNRFQAYYMEFTLDGDTHVVKVNGIGGSNGLEETRKLVANMHPGMVITILRPSKGDEEFAARTAELALDPNHVPMTNQSLKEDAAAAIAAGQTDAAPATPAPVQKPVILNSTGKPAVANPAIDAPPAPLPAGEVVIP